MRRNLLAVLLALLTGTPAFAQQGSQLGGGQIWANATSGTRPGRATSASALFDQAFCNTQGALVSRGVSLWQCITNIAVTAGGTGSATAGGARTNLGLGTLATQNANAVAITGGAITGMANPLVGSDVANKTYVDNTASSLVVLAASRLATAAILPNTPTYANGAAGVGATLTAGANSTLTVDGTIANLNDVVLVKNQASASQNGIYTVTTAGSGGAAWVLTRATYFDQAAEMLKGSYTFINAGATNLFSAFIQQTNVTTVGTDPSTWLQFSASNSSTVQSIAGNTGVFTLTAPLANIGNALIVNAAVTPGGRLTLTSGAPVIQASVTASASVIYTPYFGNLVPIYDGTNFVPTAFSELSNVNSNSAVGSAGPAAVVANSCYDYFVWSNSGVMTLTRGPAWSSLTARSAGTLLARTNGILLNVSTITNGPAAGRGTYVGTGCSNAGATFDYIFGGAGAGGVAANFGIWNMYNRVLTPTEVVDNGGGYVYVSHTPRGARNSAGNQIKVVFGLSEDAISASYDQRIDTPAASGSFGEIGIAYDALPGDIVSIPYFIAFASLAAPHLTAGAVTRTLTPGIGQHLIIAVEAGDGADSTTFGNFYQATLAASVRN